MKELHNNGVGLTNPDAARTVLGPLCLLSVLAVEQHVVQEVAELTWN